MSIRAQISDHVAAGALFPYRPRGRKAPRRRLFLTKAALTKELNNPNSAVRLLVGQGPIEAAMTRWVNGERVYGRTMRGVMRCGFLCRLDPPPPEIWEMRITEPIVRARLFVRFAEPDTLILTSMRTRGVLGARGSPGWASEMRACAKAWQELFPDHAPFTATSIHEYVTEDCDDFEI